MKTFLTVIVLLLIGAGVWYFFGNKNTEQPQTTQSTQTEQNTTDNNQTSGANTSMTISDHPVATIETSLGTFKVTLDHTAAPKTVENFVKLANDGFYKGLKFHRVIPNFVIQGGDPSGDGTGGPGYTVPAEIKLKHTKGAIAMARLSDQVNPTKASSGSQFYVALQDLPDLDGQYTVFGYVTEGMDVVAKIGATPTDPSNDMPLTDVLIKNVTITE